VYAGQVGRTRYSTWFSQKAEYLVFLRYQEVESKKVLATIAAFRVEYRPDEAGRVVGKVFAGHANGKTLAADKQPPLPVSLPVPMPALISTSTAQ